LEPILVHLFSHTQQQHQPPAAAAPSAATAAAAAATSGYTTPKKQQQGPLARQPTPQHNHHHQQQQRQQQQQEEKGEGVAQGWQALQATCYSLLNALVEASCVGSEQQLLVLPLSVTEVLQDIVAEGGGLSGGSRC
jgi:hypothetical protein